MQWIADGSHDFIYTDHQESIGRTDCFVAGASSDISEEMIKSIIVFRVFRNHDVLTPFFHNHFLCFLLPFFFKVQSKIGVHIIHR